MTEGEAPVRVADDAPTARTTRWPGLVAAALGLGGAVPAHRFVPAVGVLTWAGARGMVAGNTRLLPASRRQALGRLTDPGC